MKKQVLIFRNEGVKIGVYVELYDDENYEFPVAKKSTLGDYIVTWVQHKLFDDREMVLAKVELAD